MSRDANEDGGFELIDAPVSSADKGTTTRIETNRSTVITLAGLIGVAVLVWALTRPTSDEVGPDQALIEQGVGDTPATSLIVPTTVPGSTAPTTLVPDIALTKQPTGLWLFYGGDDSLQRVDLDTGNLDVYGLRAHPLMAVAGELVVAHAGSNTLGWVGLDNPGEQAEGWKNAWLAVDVTSPDRAWLLANDEWVLHDLAANTLLERVPVAAAPPLGGGPVGRPALMIPGPEVISTPNGVYQLETGAYRRVLDGGQVLLFDSDRALVQRCGEVLIDCTVVWRSRSGWSSQDLPTPVGPVAFAEVLGSGRWLHTIDPAGQHRLLALDDGEGLARGESFQVEVEVESLSVSSDARWLAVKRRDAGVIELIDLSTGLVESRFEGFEVGQGGTLLLVSQTP
jgi:hypothetical protein